MRAARFVLPALLLGAVAVPVTTARAADDACLSPDSQFAPTCVPEAAALNLARQVCDYEYAPGCDLTAFADPGYAVDADPNPDAPRQWMVGAVHEHSGYSDGDIRSVPRDYFEAARDGTNGMVLDFLFSSEHSDNASITPTTNAECLTGGPDAFVTCGHFTDNSFYWKWPATLKQATESSVTGGFTGIRGFEWTNDVYNHMNVFFSTNFRNVKVDGSYLSMQRMWEWLQTPVAEGGGADGLVTFNHPGSNPKLSPFDGGFPHTEVLASTGIANWNELEYIPEVDARVVGMEINGGEDIAYYVQALQNGWHIGAVAAEDHHGTSWASPSMHKTLILTGGRTPQDYYWAFSQRRTVAVHNDLLAGGVAPTIDFTADGGAHVLGSRVDAEPGSTHTLSVSTAGLPTDARVALIGSEAGQTAPIPVPADGSVEVTTDGDDWWFAVVCVGGDASVPCGSDTNYSMVTAPIWFE